MIEIAFAFIGVASFLFSVAHYKFDKSKRGK